MTDGKQGWKRWQQAALGGGVMLFIFLSVGIGLRRPWIEPLPGVRTAMTRPFVREIDLGPDSAYFFMLEAIRPPAESMPSVQSAQIWNRHWFDALTKFKHHPWPAELPPSSRRAETGKDGSDDEPPLSPEAPWTREQYEDILRLVRLYEPQVALLDRALAAPDPQMPTADSFDFALPYLQDVRAMARWLAVSGHYRAGTGDFAGAFRDFKRILGLANLISRGGTLVNHSVGIACDAMAAEAAWVIASRERVPAPVLRGAVRAFLTAHDEAEPFVEAIRADALLARKGTKEIYQNPDSFFINFHSPSRSSRVLSRFALGLLPLAGSTPASTARNLDACYQHLAVWAEKPWRPGTMVEYKTFDSRLVWRHGPATLLFRTRDPFGQIIASILIYGPEGSHLRATHREATLRGMALYLAVRAYETEHGEPPETLDALVPDYLPRIPEDPFDGQPFRYLRRNVPGLPPEAWAVYSIGENFTDEGGTAHGVGTQGRVSGASSRHTPNPDFVWPSVDYPEAGRK